MRRSKEDAEKTRLEIINAAVKVFNRKGYTASRLEDVAREAGVTRGAIYWHFENKNKLFYELCVHNQSKVAQIIEFVQNHEPNPIKALKTGLKQILEKLFTDEDFRVLEELLFKTKVKGEIEWATEEQLQRDKKDIKIVYDLLEKAKTMGLTDKKMDLNLATQIITTFFFGSFALVLTYPHLFSIQNNIDEYVDLFFNGIEKTNNITQR